MQRATHTWTPERIDEWITNSKKFAKKYKLGKTTMNIKVKKGRDRSAIIKYLTAISDQ